MRLPTSPRTETRKGFPWSSVWIVGSPPKVGKSKLVEGLWQTTKRAGAEKKVLHIDCEGSCEDLMGHIVSATSITDVRECVNELKASRNEFPVVAIDTLDAVYRWAEEETLEELRKTTSKEHGSLADLKEMGDERVGYGKDWSRARNKTKTIFEDIALTRRMLFIVAHTKVEKGGYSGVNLAIPTGLGIRVRGASQVIAYEFAYEEAGATKRAISFSPSDSTIAGSRYSELNNQIVPLPLRDKEVDGKGWVDWSGIFELFGEQPNGQPI